MAARPEIRRLKITGLRVPAVDEKALKQALAAALGVPSARVSAVRILRRSLDARQRTVVYEYTLAADIALDDMELECARADRRVAAYCEEVMPPAAGSLNPGRRPVVVGCGPAGLFAALALAERGSPPLVIERGGRMSERVPSVQAFWDQGRLNPESNVVFGEGGAGTFSDGKLTSRGTSPFKQRVLEELVACGAAREILYEARPHLGTDCLRRVIPALVERLSKRGVEFRFNTRMEDVCIEQGRVRAVQTPAGRIEAGLVVLALGHSARDTMRMLAGRSIVLQPKGFAVGVRIEHPQPLVDRAMLGDGNTGAEFGPAAYYLRYADRDSSRGVYSFCMCPGGVVIGCSSQPQTLCVNGMSFSNRASGRANAAIVVTVAPDDFSEAGGLGGLALQEHIEKKAFSSVSRPYCAPAQCAADFLQGRVSKAASIDTTFRPGSAPADLAALLPSCVVEPLRNALRAFDHKIPGFIDNGVLVGVETRTSSPVRMVRDPATFQAVGIAGLVPVGEGSGYAGGIVSSAVDGLRAGWSVMC